MHPLIWSNISGGFRQLYKISFFSIWRVHADGAWYIPCHVWYQENQVLFVHSCSHWGALWDIVYHSKFGQWCAWVQKPSGLVILHVISQFIAAIIQWEVEPRRVYFQRMTPLEMVIYDILLHLLSLFPNIIE